MYSSIASLHIALDSRLQLINSNRKQSIHPEEYDMAINDAILTVLKQRFSPELNSKKQGLEESIKRYTDLNSLKKETPLDLFKQDIEQYFNIPSDCYLPISLIGTLGYNKNFILETTDIDYFINVITLNQDTIDDNEITVEFNNGTTVQIDLNGITKSMKTMYYTLNYLKEYFKENFNIDCYIENFNEYYYSNSLILVTNDIGFTISSGLGASYSSIGSTVLIVVEGETVFINKLKKIDLVSSEDYNNINNDYYLSKNIHLNPIYKIVKNKGILNRNDTFIFKDVKLEYIKYPRLVNSRLNRMTDMTITDEILDIATTNLSGILKDETYQINKQKEQFNN